MVRLQRARIYAAVPPEVAFERLAAADLTEMMGRRHLAIPAVAAVEQDEPWCTRPGQRRTLVFSDGGRATEVLTGLDAPRSFDYELTDVRGPMRLLLATVAGRFAFEPVDGGTRVTWTWLVTPTLAGWPTMPAFGVLWRGMASRALERGERLVSA